jgi:hypothetical protein
LLTIGDDEVQKRSGQPLGGDGTKRLSQLEAIHGKLNSLPSSSDRFRSRKSKPNQGARFDFTLSKRILDELVAMVSIDQDAIDGLEKEVTHMKDVAEEWETVHRFDSEVISELHLCS